MIGQVGKHASGGAGGGWSPSRGAVRSAGAPSDVALEDGGAAVWCGARGARGCDKAHPRGVCARGRCTLRDMVGAVSQSHVTVERCGRRRCRCVCVWRRSGGEARGGAVAGGRCKGARGGAAAAGAVREFGVSEVAWARGGGVWRVVLRRAVTAQRCGWHGICNMLQGGGHRSASARTPVTRATHCCRRARMHARAAIAYSARATTTLRHMTGALRTSRTLSDRRVTRPQHAHTPRCDTAPHVLGRPITPP